MCSGANVYLTIELKCVKKTMTCSGFGILLIELQIFISLMISAHLYVTPLQFSVLIHPSKTKMDSIV